MARLRELPLEPEYSLRIRRVLRVLGAAPGLSQNPGLSRVVIRRPRQIESLRESIAVQHMRMMEANFFRRLLVHLFAARRATIKTGGLHRNLRLRGFFLLARHGLTFLFGCLSANPIGCSACKVAAIVRSMASRAGSAEIERGVTELGAREDEDGWFVRTGFLTRTVQAQP